jgi:hypothetical protein
MQPLQPVVPAHRPHAEWPYALGVVLFALCAMLIVYSGRIESGDSLQYFDAVGSLVDHGDLLLDLSARQYIPDTFDPADPLPFQTANVEPLLVIAAVPLYWAGKVIEPLGLVHAVWLLNPLVTALTAGVVFACARVIGARRPAAVAVALVFACATLAFPYSKTFFREPMLGLWIVCAAWAILVLRAARYRAFAAWLGLAAAVLALLLTKASSLAALPVLVFLALPPVSGLSRRWVWGLAGAGAAVLGLVAVLGVLPGVGGRYDIAGRLAALDLASAGTALAAYLVSPGGSVWGTSPVLVLTVPGVVGLWRRGERRLAVAIPALVVVFAAAYALTSGVHWFGGLSWPPRFLVPVLAFVSLGLVPVADRFFAARFFARTVGSALWPERMAVLAVVAVSVGVQVAFVSAWPGDYVDALPAEAGGLSEWPPGLYDPAFLRALVVPRLWPSLPPDFAWAVLGAPLAPWAFAGVGLGAAVAMFAAAGRGRGVRAASAAGACAAVIAGVAVFMNHLYAEDPRYLSADPALDAMRAVIDREAGPGDLVVLGSPRYEAYFLNDGVFWNGARVFVAFKQPGERSSPEQPAEIQSSIPERLVHYRTQLLLYNLASTRPRLFVLSDGTPDLAWSVRPVERFMAAHYPLSRAWETGPLARLTAFATGHGRVIVSDPAMMRGPAHPADAVFERAGGEAAHDRLRLVGFEYPGGAQGRPGETIAVSLAWAADAPVSASYTVAVFLRTPDGGEIAQTDWVPAATFRPTPTWQPGQRVWDHRAFTLPADAPPGDYRVWVRVYDFAPDGARRDLRVRGADMLAGDASETIAELPLRVRVE